MKDVAVSIIVPVYNVEDYLSDCLESILQQNFSDYEIICVNDGSTDRSGDILQEYASIYEQIRVFTHLQNRGLSAARNTGILNARGQYIWFVDSDDMIVEDSLASLYHIAEESQVDIVYFNVALLYDSRDVHRRGIEDNPGYEYGGVQSGKELFCQFMDNKEGGLGVWRQFIRREFIKRVGVTFYEGIIHEDDLFSFICAMEAVSVIDINQKYYIYRQRNGSILGTWNDLHAQSMFVVLVQVLAYWTGHEFSEREHRAIGRYFQTLFDYYQYVSSYVERSPELEVGSYIEKFLYKILQRKGKRRRFTLCSADLEKIAAAKNVILFGAGRVAVDIIDVLKEQNIKISIIGVSDTNQNPKMLCGINVENIENIAQNMTDAVVIIGVTEKYSVGIQQKLQALGYKDIIAAHNVMVQEDKSRWAT